MRALRNLRISVRTLAQHRGRALFSLLACTLGVSGVLVLTAIGEGARAAVIDRIGAMGRNLLVLTLRADPRLERPLGVRLSAEDAAAIVAGSSAVAMAAPALDVAAVARHQRALTPVTVVGTTPAWQRIREFPLADGRFFGEAELARSARVAVLGANANRALFGDSLHPTGRRVRIRGQEYRVIGVLVGRGLAAAGGSSEDNWVLVPLTTVQRRLANTRYVARLFLSAADASAMARAQADATAIVRARHPDDYQVLVQNQRVVLEAELQAQGALRRMIAVLAALSLLVGACGVLATMTLSVRERRAEIGLRVAVGARRRDLIVQFLVESLLLSVAGGLTGIVVGTGMVRAMTSLTSMPLAATRLTLLIALGATVGIGVLAGIWPAARAAVLDPADSLRPG